METQENKVAAVVSTLTDTFDETELAALVENWGAGDVQGLAQQAVDYVESQVAEFEGAGEDAPDEDEWLDNWLTSL